MNSAIKFPCKIFENIVTSCYQTIQCGLCDSWIHIKCNILNYIEYKIFLNSNDPWFCISCCSKVFPINSVKNSKNFISNFDDSNNKSKKTNDKYSSLLLKPSEHLKHLVNKFNNMSSPLDDITIDYPENAVASKHYNIEELQNIYKK